MSMLVYGLVFTLAYALTLAQLSHSTGMFISNTDANRQSL